MGKTRSPGLAVEQQCRICHTDLERREKPRPGEPGYCDRCLRANQTVPLQPFFQSGAAG